MDEREQLFRRLITILPELALNPKYLKWAAEQGIISDLELESWLFALKGVKNGQRIKDAFDKKAGETVISRILNIAPELMSVSTVNYLQQAGLLGDMSTADGRREATLRANALRAVFSGARLLKPTFSSDATLLARLNGVYGAVTSQYIVNFLRDLDDAKIADLRNAILAQRGGKRLTPEEAGPLRELLIKSIQKAQGARAIISTAKIFNETADQVKKQRTVFNAISVVFRNILGPTYGDRLINNAIRLGMISRSQFDMYQALRELGYTAWTRGTKAFSYEGWAARALLLAEGVFSPEMITALRETGFMPKRVASWLYPVATAIRNRARGELNDFIKSKRYRVVAGENPLQTFARLSKAGDKELLTLLAEARKDAEKAAAAAMAKGNFSGRARGAQQKIIVGSITERMRDLWEQVGYTMFFGQREAAAAAAHAEDYLLKNVWRSMDNRTARMIQEQGRAGLSSFVSRQENLLTLSERVYKNFAYSQGLIQREINKGLIRGVSAKELAETVGFMINPNTPGGVSYAAMRLARTEINNAFHFSQIRYTREMPWVEGYKWHLSGSHPKGQRNDACPDMASRNHDGIGRGVYKKANVPGKPHPHCLCYLTNVTMDNKTFDKRLKSGAFDQYIKGNEAAERNAVRLGQDQQRDDDAMRLIKTVGLVVAIAK